MSVDARQRYGPLTTVLAKRRGDLAVGKYGRRPRSRALGGILLAAALGTGLLAGCKSNSDQGSPAPGSAGPSATASPSGSASAGTSKSPGGQGPSRSQPGVAPSEPPPPATDLETHRGTMAKGVEPGCLILRTSNGNFELVGANAQAKKVLRPDTDVVVRGYQQKGLMSHCMQGKIFKVVSAKAAN